MNGWWRVVKNEPNTFQVHDSQELCQGPLRAPSLPHSLDWGRFMSQELATVLDRMDTDRFCHCRSSWVVPVSSVPVFRFTLDCSK